MARFYFMNSYNLFHNFYYSCYVFCRHKIGGARKSPDMWAIAYVIFFSLQLFFCFDLFGSLYEIDIWTFGLKHESKYDLIVQWPALLLCFFNFWYFEKNDKGRIIVMYLDALNSAKKTIIHIVSTFIVVAIMATQFYLFFTLHKHS